MCFSSEVDLDNTRGIYCCVQKSKLIVQMAELQNLLAVCNLHILPTRESALQVKTGLVKMWYTSIETGLGQHWVMFLSRPDLLLIHM